jgi:uncharacterized protein YdaU (DUF1376 family)
MSVPKRVNPSPAAVSFKGVLKSGKFMHYYKFNIADYRKDTGHLSTIEHGIYRQLIDWYYLDEQPIPEETQVVIRRLRLGSDEVKFLQNVLSDFFVLGKTGYKHKRIEVEIKDYQEQAEKNKNNGKLGGRPKKTQSVISGLPDESQNNPNQEPITINHKPNKEKATVVATPEGVSDSVWQEFKSLRKAKKAPITQRAIDAITTEANKANWTLEKALEECVVRGWQAFKADWVIKPNHADIGRVTVPPSNEPEPALLKIEADRKKAVPIPLEVLAKMAELRKRA